MKKKYLLPQNIGLVNQEAKTFKVIHKQSKADDLSRVWPEGSLFNSYYTEV